MIGQLKLVGLTGGIGSGKSTVATMLRDMGIPVLDADLLAREIVAPGEPALNEIAALWPDVIAADGRLDRKQLAAKVFADPEARRRLEAITHPRIAERALLRAGELARAGHQLAFYEASLLIEAGRQGDFDALVVVTASPEQQIMRVMARDGLTRDQALDRIRAQLPLADKRALATHLVLNEGDLRETGRQVRDLVAELKRE